MLRVLSVSYDTSLLSSRALLLESMGYGVVSVSEFNKALQCCSQSARFDLFVLGHSIPHTDKEALVTAFRAHSAAPIIALNKPGEEATLAADWQVDPDPMQFVDAVSRAMSNRAASA